MIVEGLGVPHELPAEYSTAAVCCTTKITNINRATFPVRFEDSQIVEMFQKISLFFRNITFGLALSSDHPVRRVELSPISQAHALGTSRSFRILALAGSDVVAPLILVVSPPPSWHKEIRKNGSMFKSSFLKMSYIYIVYTIFRTFFGALHCSPVCSVRKSIAVTAARVRRSAVIVWLRECIAKLKGLSDLNVKHQLQCAFKQIYLFQVGLL